MTTPYPITEIFVWLIDDPTSEHAILGVATPAMGIMQAVSSKRSNMERESIRLIAHIAARDTGHPVKLQRFVLAETLQEVKA